MTVTVGGTQKFSGPVNNTTNFISAQPPDPNTLSLIQFDLDVENMPDPLPNHDQWGEWVTNIPMIISVTGGDIQVQAIRANFNALLIDGNVQPKFTPGTVDNWFQLRYATQPVWTPPATDRLTIADNVNSGPGSLLLLENEVVNFQIAMTYYSAA